VLRFHWKWSDYELNEARHMRESFTAILEALGGTINAPAPRGGGAGPRGRGAGAAGARAPPRPVRPPKLRQQPGQPACGSGGGIIHEVGCVRMGDDRRESVLNKFCQAHDVRNLFVADGGPFVSHADKNPTHTIIALAWRTAEYLAEELRKGNV
jgi:choline dehydrogenase-like flavoprotein